MTGIEGRFEVAGANAALSFFTTLEPGRLGHGYLFTGPGGVGKKTFARELAHSLLCETPKATILGYCGACPDCALFVAGTHPDFFYNDLRISIGDESGDARQDAELTSRDLIRALALHGYRGRHRVVVLGDVAFAKHEAANALLKLFEEPQAGVVVVLTSNRPGSLLPTIRSRFVELAFGPLPTAAVNRILLAGGAEPERARLAAELSLGSVTRARAVLNEDGLGIRDASYAWFESAVRGELPDAAFLSLDDRERSGADKRAAVAQFVELVRTAARDWVALRLAGNEVPLLATDRRALFEALPPRAPAALVASLAAVGDAQRIAASNVSPGLVLEYLRIGLAPTERGA